MNSRIAASHRDKFYKLILDNGQTVLVVPPATRTSGSNASEKVLGTTTFSEGEGTAVSVNAWVHQAAVPSGFSYGGLAELPAMLGKLAESDLILSLKIADGLLDADKPYGRTIFDKAKRVEVSGSDFEVTGVFRSGLAPLGPYILWVGLRNSGE